MNQRSRLTGIATGDQAVFVQRRLFESVAGFAAMPLMEDIELSRRLKAIEAPACLRERVTTSGRRWDQHGFWRTVLLMWRLRAAHALGADAHTLALRYGYRPRAPAAVAMFAKAPVAGLAKTRLIPLLGAAGAARAQRGFALQNPGHGARSEPGWRDAVVRARCGTPLLSCAAWAPRGVTRWPSPRAIWVNAWPRPCRTTLHSTPQTPLLIVGTDCPALTPAHLQQAADALQTVDVVLIPAEDGGYVLIGLRRPVPEVFNERGMEHAAGADADPRTLARGGCPLARAADAVGRGRTRRLAALARDTARADGVISDRPGDMSGAARSG